jgi:predicted kinase
LNNTLDFSHPDGPNIGPASDPGWLENHDQEGLPVKTDLLHTGHMKGGKLLICVIGLPARGKTYIARKVARYLRWINYRTRVFCLARYRQDKYGHKQAAEFFDTANKEYTSSRMELLACALDDSVGYLNRGGEVAILDGTNVTEARRNAIRERLQREDGYEILWIESICEDPQVIAHNVAQLREASPDYVADHDFERRIAFYKIDYVHVREEEGSYAKVFDAGRKLELNRIHGFLPTKIISFLMNLHIMPRPVYFTR